MVPFFYLYTLVDAFKGASRAPQVKFYSRWYLYVLLIFSVNLFILPLLFRFVNEEIVEAYVIPGVSMEPTIIDNERLFVLKSGHKKTMPERGDIIVFSAPDDGEKEYIKRVIGVGGDKVEVRMGELYLNGMLYDEPYIALRRPDEGIDMFRDNIAALTLAKDEVFVMGDNRKASRDSRSFGPVPVRSIEGKAIKIYYSMDPYKGLRLHRIGKLL